MKFTDLFGPYPFIYIKVSVQGVVALGGNFATLYRELDFYFYEAIFFFIIIFQKILDMR